jgi:hypothetical protein
MTMLASNVGVDSKLTWVQTGIGVGQATYELRAGDSSIGALRWHGTVIMRGEAETSDGRWAFEPDGIMSRTVLILDSRSAQLMARYDRRFGQGPSCGILTFSDGGRLEWVRELIGVQGWAFSREEGTPIAHFRECAGPDIDIELTEAAQSERHLSLLLALGYYLCRVGQEEQRTEARRTGRRCTGIRGTSRYRSATPLKLIDSYRHQS